MVRPDDLGYYFYFYDAFGQLAGALTPQSVDPDIPDNALDRIPIGFGGQWGYYTDITSEAQQDSTGIQAGLVLLGQRYYDPGTARFLTRDPIGYDGGINVYAYTGNNPVNSADPSGLDDVTVNLETRPALGENLLHIYIRVRGIPPGETKPIDWVVSGDKDPKRPGKFGPLGPIITFPRDYGPGQHDYPADPKKENPNGRDKVNVVWDKKGNPWDYINAFKVIANQIDGSNIAYGPPSTDSNTVAYTIVTLGLKRLHKQLPRHLDPRGDPKPWHFTPGWGHLLPGFPKK